MPYVQIPKDLSKIKNKVVFNLTTRQLICFGVATVIGVPTYILTRDTLGNQASVLLMMGIMLPFFLLAMYEKDAQPAEKVLRNYIRANFFYPKIRLYKTENFYNNVQKNNKEVKLIGKQNKKTGYARKTIYRRKIPGKKK